jgi:hypothetical protein
MRLLAVSLYLGEQIEAAPLGPFPAEWTKDEATAAK